jgi:hypothetical protein
MMEYRFSLTPRLVAVGLMAGVALLVLLFALGFQVGQGMAEKANVPELATDAAVAPAPAPAPAQAQAQAPAAAPAAAAR